MVETKFEVKITKMLEVIGVYFKCCAKKHQSTVQAKCRFFKYQTRDAYDPNCNLQYIHTNTTLLILIIINHITFRATCFDYFNLSSG